MLAFKICSYTVSVIMFVLMCRFLFISFGYLKVNKVKGYLKVCEHKRNVYKGGKSGRFYEHWVDSVYMYRVGEKEYSICVQNPGKPNQMEKTVDVIYQIKNPKYSYIKQLTFPLQPLFTLPFFMFSIIFLIVGVFS